jgi:hypothetical protein
MHRVTAIAALALAVALPCHAQVCILSLLNDPPKQRVVDDFADTLQQRWVGMGTNLLAALDNFENAMQFSSSFEAEPKVGEALLQLALTESLDALVGLADEHVPGTKQVVAAIKAASEETKRAAAAQASHDVGAWIRAERAVVANQLTGAKSGELPTSVKLKDAILEDLCNAKESGASLDAEIQKLAGAQAELGSVPSEQTYRRAIYEGWINANYKGVGMADKTPGTVYVFWEVDVQGDPNKFSPGSYPLAWDDGAWKAEVILPEPYGARVASGLNELGVKPLAVRAVKKACFETDGIAGGTATYCGALDKDGRERFTPNAPWATQAFQSSHWREATTAFRD